MNVLGKFQVNKIHNCFPKKENYLSKSDQEPFSFPLVADGIFIHHRVYYTSREMVRELALNHKGITFSEAFTEYLSDITLEVEAIKLRSLKSDIKGINEHLARIENTLWDIANAKLALAERINRTSD